MAEQGHVRQTIDLVIIAKSSWTGGYCYLGYDQADSRIRRPIIFRQKGQPAQPWPEDQYLLELFHVYSFELSDEGESAVPHGNEDVWVKQGGWTQTRAPWTHEQLYRMLCPLATGNTELFFQQNGKIYAKKGVAVDKSVAVLKCWKSQLQFSWQRDGPKGATRPLIYYGDHKFNFTAADSAAKPIGKFINKEPEQEVLVIFLLASPITAMEGIPAWDSPRCYVLAVAVIKSRETHTNVATPPAAAAAADEQGHGHIGQTIDLVIIAKSSWTGGYCYLGYDQADSRIRRPIISQEGQPAQPWPNDQQHLLELFKVYSFELSDQQGESNLPHENEDVWVKPGGWTPTTEAPWTEERLYTEITSCRPILAYRHILDVFPQAATQPNGKMYVEKGVDERSVGVMQCRKSQLHFCWEKDTKPLIHYYNNHYYTFDFRAADNAAYATKDIINSNGPEQEVLVVFLLGSPIGPHHNWDRPRCYVLAVAVIKPGAIDTTVATPPAAADDDEPGMSTLTEDCKDLNIQG